MIDELIWIIFFWKIISGFVNFLRIEFYYKFYYSFFDIEVLRKVWSEYLVEIVNFVDNFLVLLMLVNVGKWFLNVLFIIYVMYNKVIWVKLEMNGWRFGVNYVIF